MIPPHAPALIRSVGSYLHDHAWSTLAAIGGASGAAWAAFTAMDRAEDFQSIGHHAWAWYMVGADSLLLAAIAIRAFRQTRVNLELQRQLTEERRSNEDLGKRVGVLEGVAKERGWRIEEVTTALGTIRDRTIILRDCDEDHERRIVAVENRLQMARDRAVARLALRGAVFEDPQPQTLAQLGRFEEHPDPSEPPAEAGPKHPHGATGREE